MIQVLLPLILAATIWQWPAQGYGVAPEWGDATDVSALAGNGWYFDWSARCKTADQVPLVYDGRGAWEWTWLAACNDGRPVLVTNEPERADQANLTPEQTAQLLQRIVGMWRGEVWCCGWNMWPGGSEHALNTVDAYQRLYGAWPNIGWHVHIYPPWEASLARYDGWVSELQRRGILGRGVIVSEYGAPYGDAAAQMRQMRAKFAQRPEIVSAAWFVAHDNAAWANSSLVDDAGNLTAAGWEWRQ
jgi:hypothetical protein